MSTSPGGVPQSYTGQVVVCSDCFTPQVFEGKQCAGCHSEFGGTAWPFVSLEICMEDAVSRGVLTPDEISKRMREAANKVAILEVTLAFEMRCTGLWENWISCPDLGRGCQFCSFFQYGQFTR